MKPQHFTQHTRYVLLNALLKNRRWKNKKTGIRQGVRQNLQIQYEWLMKISAVSYTQTVGIGRENTVHHSSNHCSRIFIMQIYFFKLCHTSIRKYHLKISPSFSETNAHATLDDTQTL